MSDLEKRLERRLDREKRARREAESLLEAKASELYEANENLRDLLATQEKLIDDRTEELQATLRLAEQANTHKSFFLANMSHEIRTPMNAVIGLSHLLMETELNRQQNGYVNKIQKSAANLLDIINDILDFSKIEAGHLSISEEEFDLDELLQSVYDVNSVRANDKGISFTVNRDFSIPNHLVGDSVRVNQVLTNLVSNAVKFTETGSVSLDLLVKAITAEQVTLFISVEDTGIGIEQTRQEGIFEAFTQADSSTTRSYGGTGLGLSITKQLIELMGGKIKLDSLIGEGTRVLVELPFRVALRQESRNHILREKNLLLIGQDTEVSSLLDSMALNFTSMPYGKEHLSEIQDYYLNHKIDSILIVDQPESSDELIDYLAVLRYQCPEVILSPTIVFTNPRNAKAISMDKGEYDCYSISDLHTPSVLLDTLSEALDVKFDEQIQVGSRLSRNDMEDIIGSRVLLVEDNLINTEVAKGMLERMGIITFCAENGQEAIDLLSSETVDLVLMDLQMPVMDGYEATSEIRNKEELSDLPVIALTAHAMVGDHARSLNAGMNDHITKPIDPDELMATLLKWIKPQKRERVSNKEILQQSDSVISLPDILPGLKYTEALKRVSGDVGSYLSLWERFFNQNKGAKGHLEALLASNDLDSLRAYAHNVKGVGANLGAYELSELFAKIEKVSSPSDVTIDLLNQVSSAEDKVAQSVEQIWDAFRNEEIDKPAISEEELLEICGKLRLLLISGDTEALSYAPQLESATTGTSRETVSKEIVEAIGDFEFERASTLLDGLMSEHE